MLDVLRCGAQSDTRIATTKQIVGIDPILDSIWLSAIQEDAS
jgi:hypothetical protein